MQLDASIAARADAMVARCGLDSTSLFFCDRRRAEPALRYLHHVGVSQEAQHIYEHERVFAEDPFPSVVEHAPAGRMVRWTDRDLAGAADSAVGYRSFLTHYSVDVVGAFVQQVLPGLFFVLGAHCRPGAHRKADIAHRLLEHEVEGIAGMVVTQLLRETLSGSAGASLIDGWLTPVRQGRSATSLTRREREIADLVGAGKLNKQVAHLLGLSEFTIENHLRRIYRKLGVHNRAGMAAALRGALSHDGFLSLRTVAGSA
jgi:DNA-binding CsgD family transcriptional regulator